MKPTTPAPVEKVSIPVKPLLGTVANAVALGVAGVAAGGTTAVVATVAGLTAATAVVKKGKKVAVARAQRRASGASGSGRSGTKSGTLRSGKASGVGASKSRTGATGAGARKAKTGIAGIGAALRKGSALRQNGGTGARPPARRAPGSGKSTPARSGSGRSGSLAARARRIANSPASRSARKHLAGAARRASSGIRSSSAATRKARRKVWGSLRKFVQRKVMGRDPEAAKKKLTRQNPGRDIKPNLTRGLINPPYAPQYARNTTPPLAGDSSPYVNNCQGGNMLHHAQEMLTYVSDWKPANLLEIIGEIDASCAPSLNVVADVFSTFSEKSRNEFGFDESIVLKFALIAECLGTAANMAKSLAEDIEITEEDALRRLRNPRAGEELRDLSAHGMA